MRLLVRLVPHFNQQCGMVCCRVYMAPKFIQKLSVAFLIFKEIGTPPVYRKNFIENDQKLFSCSYSIDISIGLIHVTKAGMCWFKKLKLQQTVTCVVHEIKCVEHILAKNLVWFIGIHQDIVNSIMLELCIYVRNEWLINNLLPLAM